MKIILRLLGMITVALCEVAENKPNAYRFSIYGARDKWEAGEMSRQDYNAAFKPEKDF